ncbi:prolyl 4-hydroxylase subunit alpha-1-like [Eriocheir sinensis]|uniref:prolyl 4-hydroxylase subunit alpha-1-like n=1 Tax=Eriocheir sinensis TaxID=95602 RepID=UPI0021C72806|nr:prolyl 4-hydroxylase subunit alpha-1-like [Eriocheir sinensis]XP_050693507.1 prolyl 4-hydroxylase subunit alpha-1-like [Eriocheir sinensis]XP_050693508.1 prolyl 4-hydroxylase subunit alpha-1-like [Eriocheir sinensis]XP_050693509.1 prolyl 4-hydroxylase subunit alpha-1-like [Eriocheir sinensis]
MAAVAMVSCLVGLASAGHALHTSWMQLEELWHAEYKTVEQIRAISQPVAELSDALQRYIVSWEGLVEDSNSGPLHLASEDPAAGLSLLRHVAEGWTQVDDALFKVKHILHHIEHLASRVDREVLPNAADVAAASEAVARLAHVYGVNATALAAGGRLVLQAVTGHDHHHHHHLLSVNDLTSVGLVAVNKGFLDVGVQFLQVAKARAAASQQARLSSLLATAVRVHDHVLALRGPRTLTHATAPTPHGSPREEHGAGAEEAGVVLGVDYLRRHANASWMLERRPLLERLQVERLCRGEDLRAPHVTSRLRCRYASGGSSWLSLAPLKVEQASLDPYIAVVYEVVSRRDAAHLRDRTRSRLHTQHCPVGDPHAASPVTSWSHECASVRETEEAAVAGVGRRLGHLLGVSLDDAASEPYMVVNHGLGGEYGAHRDTHGPSRTPPQPEVGERLATVLTHLQAPAQGGRTVFPWVGVGVGGTDGAALVWWNLLASHEHDFLIRRADCPVVLGHKTVLTKWVGYAAQWKRLPCPADPSRKVMLPWH